MEAHNITTKIITKTKKQKQKGNNKNIKHECEIKQKQKHQVSKLTTNYGKNKTNQSEKRSTTISYKPKNY